MRRVDLAVIGAGIHGAAIAAAATARGHRVVVIEQACAAATGTSSKSSKLIHGGLRYLESAQFKLVRECLRERRRLLAEHPDLVRLVPFYIPVYQTTRRRPWLIAAGLSLYTLLGGRRFHRVPRRHWQHLEGLKTRGLQAVFCYLDAQTDDRRLTEGVLAQAQRQGAEVRFNTEFTAASCSDRGCRLTCSCEGRAETLETRLLVNASGPWVNRTLARIEPRAAPIAMQLVQGTHILVAAPAIEHIYYLEAPTDRRAVFVMPWQGRVLIGTTETDFQGSPDRVAPLAAEIDYLLQTWNHYFDPPLQHPAVIDSFAGLRVLPAGEARPFDRHRDTRLHRDPDQPRVLSVCGGKLTSHRLTAERVIAALEL